MRLVAISACLVAAMSAIAFAQAAPAAIAIAVKGYSVDDSDTPLDDPAAKAVVDKHIPGFSSKDQVDMARSMTLKGIQQYAPDMVTDKVLSDIQVDLAKLPVKK